MALPAQLDGAGVSALAQLPLLPFLAASPGPALVLPLSPLAHALRARQHAPSPLKTPLWSAHQPQAAANAAAATGSQGSAKPAIKRFRSNSDATPTLSQLHDQGPGTEVIRASRGSTSRRPSEPRPRRPRQRQRRRRRRLLLARLAPRIFRCAAHRRAPALERELVRGLECRHAPLGVAD